MLFHLYLVYELVAIFEDVFGHIMGTFLPVQTECGKCIGHLKDTKIELRQTHTKYNLTVHFLNI